MINKIQKPEIVVLREILPLCLLFRHNAYIGSTLLQSVIFWGQSAVSEGVITLQGTCAFNDN